MATLSERGAAALIRRQEQADGVTIAYTRGATTAPIVAVHGLTTATSAELPGRVEISARDYLIAVSRMATAGFGKPVVGDRITETIDGTDVTFELQTPPNGEPAVRYTNELRVQYRLHMKAV